MSIDDIVRVQNAKLDGLLDSTNLLLERVEGPNCSRHYPTFNIANHPYYYEYFARMTRFRSASSFWSGV